MKKMMMAILVYFWPGTLRQKEQIDRSRQKVLDRTVTKLNEAIEDNNRQTDIFEKLICDLRSTGNNHQC